MPAKTAGSRTSPSSRSIAGSPSSEKRSLTKFTPEAKSDSASRKSSTAKSPSRRAMPTAAGTVSSRASTAMTSACFHCPLLTGTTVRRGTCCSFLTGAVERPRASSHWSTLILSTGAQMPVSRKAAKMPHAASTPKERRAAMSEKRFAAKAAVVVSDVSRMARPTRRTVICVASSGLRPRPRSSLYRWSAWRLSSMPSAITRMGSRLENCERAMKENPSHSVTVTKWPMRPCIHSRAPPRATMTMATSEGRRKETKSSTAMARPISAIRPALAWSSRLTSTLTPCPTCRLMLCWSCWRSMPSSSITLHSTEQGPLPSSTMAVQVASS